MPIDDERLYELMGEIRTVLTETIEELRLSLASVNELMEGNADAEDHERDGHPYVVRPGVKTAD